MKTYKFLLLAVLIPAFGGCISSLNPLYTEKDLIYNPDLLGTWRAEDSQLSFISNNEKDYILISTDGAQDEDFKARLLKLGNSTFLDISPVDSLRDNYFFHATHFPVHIFFKIDIGREEIIISEFDGEILNHLIKSSGEKISLVRSQDDRILLTASTRELQEIVQKYQEIFGNPVTFKKEY